MVRTVGRRRWAIFPLDCKVGATGKHLSPEKGRSPAGDQYYHDAVEEPEAVFNGEDTAIEKQNAKLDGAICRLLYNHVDIVELKATSK